MESVVRACVKENRIGVRAGPNLNLKRHDGKGLTRCFNQK